MTYDFFADESDKIEVLNYIFRETDLQVFDHYSALGQQVTEYKTTEQIVSKFDLRNGDKFSVTFNLWTPRLKGDLIFRKVNLDPKRCNGHTFRYSTDGWGLIQLYFGGIKNHAFHNAPKSSVLNVSHIGHQSQKRAMAWEGVTQGNGQVSKWDWKEVEKTGRALKYHIHTHLAKRKIGSVDILHGADKLEEQGITFR